ncbi:MAG TPA: hypothetical protein VHK70_00865 [Burkholderiaceae bacterium]|jgi:hypothetical protein|nr:hypothetical protein [Burkholderiaceae bacterium]
MLRPTLGAAIGLWLAASALAQPPRPLDDAELSGIDGRDGVALALHLSLNDPTLPNAVADSRLSVGFNVDGTNTYLVVKNLRGAIDLFSVTVDIRQKPDGTDYVALGLPGHVKFTNFGFESLSAQADPLAPVTESLGRINLDGTLSLKGELRLWAH